MDTTKIIGKIISFDPIKDLLVIKTNFIDIETQKELEDFISSDKNTAISINKFYRELKTYSQLKRYHAMCKTILIKLGVYPTAENVKTFDEEIVKRKIAKCEKTVIGGEEVPTVRSKADWGKEEIKEIMEKIQDRYAYLKIDWNSYDWYNQDEGEND